MFTSLYNRNFCGSTLLSIGERNRGLPLNPNNSQRLTVISCITAGMKLLFGAGCGRAKGKQLSAVYGDGQLAVGIMLYLAVLSPKEPVQ